MAELHPSGIAMVYGLHVNSDHNGLIVQTEFPIPEGGSFLNPLTGGYQQYDDIGTAWLCTGDIEPHGYALYDPRNLMPIDNTDPDVIGMSTCDTDKVVLYGD